MPFLEEADEEGIWQPRALSATAQDSEAATAVTRPPGVSDKAAQFLQGLAGKLKPELVALAKAGMGQNSKQVAAADLYMRRPGGVMLVVLRGDGVSPSQCSSYTIFSLSTAVCGNYVLGDLAQRPQAMTPLMVVRGGCIDWVQRLGAATCSLTACCSLVHYVPVPPPCSARLAALCPASNQL